MLILVILAVLVEITQGCRIPLRNVTELIMCVCVHIFKKIPVPHDIRGPTNLRLLSILATDPGARLWM